MIIQVDNTVFFLTPNEGLYGDIHAQMALDFQDESNLERFKQLLRDNPDTAFAVYNNLNPTFDLADFLNRLSTAFDLKFETYWRAKGYTDIFDLLSHAANPESVYNAEALSLLQWSHSSWQIAVTDLDENSNIETIINSLPDYE